jgi:hypothetical protein
MLVGPASWVEPCRLRLLSLSDKSLPMERDQTLDTLLDLDGLVFVVEQSGQHWVKFEVRSITPTREKPHGLDYSLTLHGPSGERLVGFDNAHSVKASGGPGGKREAWDHKHRLRTIRPYDYSNAAALIEDFWKLVDDVLEERGVKR